MIGFKEDKVRVFSATYNKKLSNGHVLQQENLHMRKKSFQNGWSNTGDILECASLKITKIPCTVPEKDGITSEFNPALGTALDQITSRILSNLSHSIIL